MNFKPHIIEAYGPQQVPEIAKFVESNLYETGKDRPSHGVTKTAKVSTVQWNTCRHFLDWSQQLAKFWNSKEIGFDIYDMTDIDLVNYNLYSSQVQGEYGWHWDGSADTPVDTKLTVIVNISDEPYEGGDLELFVNEPRPIDEMRKPGTVIIFPSIIMHRVTPVTKGVRKTLSYWITGPKFR
jgi:PKHD-type hydroxylase